MSFDIPDAVLDQLADAVYERIRGRLSRERNSAVDTPRAAESLDADGSASTGSYSQARAEKWLNDNGWRFARDDAASVLADFGLIGDDLTTAMDSWRKLREAQRLDARGRVDET